MLKLEQVSSTHENSFTIYKDGKRQGFLHLEFDGRDWHWVYQSKKTYKLSMYWSEALNALKNIEAEKSAVLRLKAEENETA